MMFSPMYESSVYIKYIESESNSSIFNDRSGEVTGLRMSFRCQIDQRRKISCFSSLERRVFKPNQPL